MANYNHIRKTTPERPALEVVVQEKDIAQLLLRLGFQPHMRGYHYILYAVKIILKDPEIIHFATKKTISCHSHTI